MALVLALFESLTCGSNRAADPAPFLVKTKSTMRKHSITRKGILNAAMAGGIALLTAGLPCFAQSAKVAAGSVQITPDLEKKELAVGFRLVDAVGVTSVSAVADGLAEPLTATWEAWEGTKSPACAWMIVVDTSNPARSKTIEACKDAVRAFLTGLPKTDAVAIYGLARDLDEVVPFGSNPDDALAGVSTLKADGDASKTTLIYQNLREGLSKLSVREETRKAVILITDAKDETPGGPAAQEIEKNKLIEAAKTAGVVVHCLGYAEKLDDQKYFGALKEISSQTEGLYYQASVGTKDLPEGALSLLRGVMQGAGMVRVNVEPLEKPVGLTLTVKTASGAEAVLKIPAEKVAQALPPEVVSAPGGPETKTEEEIAKEEAEAEEEARKIAAAEKEKAEAGEKARADQKAADDRKRLLMIVGVVVLLAIILGAFLMMRASRRRAAEEEARLAEATRLAEDARIAEQTRRAGDETKKAEVKPLAWLEMCDAQQTRHPVRITSLKIGRGQHNDFVLRNDSVSGNHCVLNCTREGQWSVTDLNSGNGVVLNGTRVQQSELRHGDTIELGELKMRFLLKN